MMEDRRMKRYLEDPTFHKVVKVMENIIRESDLTHQCILDACFVARIRFEAMNVRPILYSESLRNQEVNK